MRVRSQKGTSLVEVMVALFVLAIGLLGILAMQSKSMQYNQSAHVYSQAVYLANDIAERIRSNFDTTVNYAGAIATAEPKNCENGSCTAAELAAWDRYDWNRRIARFLPGGTGAIERVTATATVPAHYRVLVSFDDSRADGKQNGENGYNGTKTYALVVEI